MNGCGSANAFLTTGLSSSFFSASAAVQPDRAISIALGTTCRIYCQCTCTVHGLRVQGCIVFYHILPSCNLDVLSYFMATINCPSAINRKD